MIQERGEQLVTNLIDAASDDYDFVANELLQEIYKGYPVESVSLLIHSDTPEAIKAGAWLLSELGLRAESIKNEIPYLLGHELRNARYFGIDALLGSGSLADPGSTAKAIALISDPEEAVRRKTMALLARLPLQQLQASIIYVDDPKLREMTEWLIKGEDDPSRPEGIVQRLHSRDVLTRQFAAVAAVRTAGQDERPIRSAAGSADSQIRIFARRELDIRRG